MKRFAVAASVVALLLVALAGVTRVGRNDRAVLDPRFGKPSVLDPGFHFRAPLLSRVSHYSLWPQTVKSRVRVQSRDNMGFVLSYSLEEAFHPDYLLVFHARRAGRPLAPVLKQLTDESVRTAATFLRADELLGQASRERWLGVLYPPTQERGLKALSMEVEPPAAKIYLNTALLYQQRNLERAALQIAQLAVERLPREPISHHALGRIHQLQGREKQAENEYEQALFLDPAAPEPMGRLVSLLLMRKEFDRAQRLLDAALEKDRASAPHFNWLGVTLQLKAEYEEAGRAFQKAVELEPKNAEYRANQGALLLAKGNYLRAQESLREAIQIRPDYSLALYNLGVALALDGKPAEAIPFFERVGQSGAPSVGLLNALAQAYQETGQTAKAVAALERSLRLQPKQPDQQRKLRQLQSVSAAPPPRKRS